MTRLLLPVLLATAVQASDLDDLIPQLSPPYAVDVHLRLARQDPARHVSTAQGIYSSIRNPQMASVLAPPLVERLISADPETAESVAKAAENRRDRAAACEVVIAHWQDRDRGRALRLMSDCARSGAVPTKSITRLLPGLIAEDLPQAQSLLTAVVEGIAKDISEAEIEFLLQSAARIDPHDAALSTLIVHQMIRTVSDRDFRRYEDTELVARALPGGEWLTRSTQETFLLRIAWLMKNNLPDMHHRMRLELQRWSRVPEKMEFVRRLRGEREEDRELWEELDELEFDDAIAEIDDVEQVQTKVAMWMHMLGQAGRTGDQRYTLARHIMQEAGNLPSRERTLEVMRRLSQIRLRDGDHGPLRQWARWLKSICQPDGIPVCLDAYGDFLELVPEAELVSLLQSDPYLESRRRLGR